MRAAEEKRAARSAAAKKGWETRRQETAELRAAERKLTRPKIETRRELSKKSAARRAEVADSLEQLADDTDADISDLYDLSYGYTADAA